MTFEDMLDEALAMLQRRGRVTYRALQLQCHRDDDLWTALKDELSYAHPEVRNEAERGLVWSGASHPQALAQHHKATRTLVVPILS